MRFLLLLCSLFALVPPVQGQAKVDPKTELRKMVREAGNDVGKLVAAAAWAKSHDLAKDAKALYQKVLTKDPDNQAANEGLGRVRHEGKWLEASEVEKLLAAAIKKGEGGKDLALVDGIMVEKEHVADAKRGVFHHGGEVVGKWEKLRLLQGMVRHPVTGVLIDAADKAKADQGQFPLENAKWGDEAQANAAHEDSASPWIVRTRHAWILSTLPIDSVTDQVTLEVDKAIEQLLPVFGDAQPHPDRRPIVQVLTTAEQFADFGERFGGSGSAHGAFLTEQVFRSMAGVDGRIAVSHWHADWGKYYTRHAAGLALCSALCGDEIEDVPEWFQRAVGSFVERHATTPDAKHFGKQHAAKGGVKDFARWLDEFKISGDLPPSGFGSIDYNVYQAGLVLSFCQRGGDAQVTAALTEVSGAFRAGKKVAPAIRALQKLLGTKEAEVAAYFAKVIG